jgi:ankyrin repeat protein
LQFTLLQLAAMIGRSDRASELIEIGADVDFATQFGITALMLACMHGHLEMVRLLLAHGASMEKGDESKETPLLFAIQEQQLEVIQFLVENGANVEHANLDGNTALLLAVSANDCEAVAFLLANGANPGHINKLGDNALLVAVNCGFDDIVLQLLKHGVNLETPDACGRPALFLAVLNANPVILALLIGQGANPDHVDHRGDTPLMAAAQAGSTACARLLVNAQSTAYPGGANIHFINKSGVNALMRACENGHVALARLLLENGAPIERANPERETPLLLAAQANHKEVLALLVEKHANLEHVNVRGDTALLLAIHNKLDDIVSFLLAKGADGEHACRGWTPLASAVYEGAGKVVTILLKHGVDLEKKIDGGSYTALQIAAMYGQTEIVSELIEHGANRDYISPSGHTAVSTAFANRKFDTAKVLIKAGANIRLTAFSSSFLVRAAESDDAECVALLIQKGANVNQPDHTGVTPLMAAARSNSKHVLALVLQQGRAQASSRMSTLVRAAFGYKVALDLQCDLKCTALAHAASNGHHEITSLLVDAGAMIDLPDRASDTPLHHAVRNGHALVVKLLLHHGASLAHQNNAGLNALDLAFSLQARDSHIIDMLLDRAFSVDIAKGKANGVISIDAMLASTCAVLHASCGKEQAETIWVDHAKTLCMSFGLRHAIATTLIDAARNMPASWLGGAGKWRHPSLAQVRCYTDHVVGTLANFHELQCQTAPGSQEKPGTTQTTPKSSKRLNLFAAGQAGALLAFCTTAQLKWKHKLVTYLSNLTPETTPAMLAAFLNDDLGMHPLLAAHTADVWDKLDHHRSMARLIKALNERIVAPEFVSELETAGPDMLRSMLLAQMQILF